MELNPDQFDILQAHAFMYLAFWETALYAWWGLLHFVVHWQTQQDLWTYEFYKIWEITLEQSKNFLKCWQSLNINFPSFQFPLIVLCLK